MSAEGSLSGHLTAVHRRGKQHQHVSFDGVVSQWRASSLVAMWSGRSAIFAAPGARSQHQHCPESTDSCIRSYAGASTTSAAIPHQEIRGLLGPAILRRDRGQGLLYAGRNQKPSGFRPVGALKLEPSALEAF